MIPSLNYSTPLWWSKHIEYDIRIMIQYYDTLLGNVRNSFENSWKCFKMFKI